MSSVRRGPSSPGLATIGASAPGTGSAPSDNQARIANAPAENEPNRRNPSVASVR